MDKFVVWCLGQDDVEDFDELKSDFKQLQFMFVQYLESYRLKEKGSEELVRPKANTLNRIKSMLSTELSRLTGEFYFKTTKRLFRNDYFDLQTI